MAYREMLITTVTVVLVLSGQLSLVRAADGGLVGAAAQSAMDGWGYDLATLEGLDELASTGSDFSLDGDLTGGGGSEATESSDGVVVERWAGEDGRQEHRRIMFGELVVDIVPPGSYRDGDGPRVFRVDGVVVAVVYGCQLRKTLRANGYTLDVPLSAAIEKVELGEDGKVRLEWLDGTRRMVVQVPALLDRGETLPGWEAAALRSQPCQQGQEGGAGEELGSLDEDLDLPGLDDGDSAEEPPSSETVSTAGPVATESHADESHADDLGTGFAGTCEQGTPGNRYGVSPVLSDGEVEMVAQQAIDGVRNSYCGPAGTSLNEWGVMVGNGISHTGGIDGYASPIHYWLATNATVRSAVEEAVRNVTTHLRQR